MASARTSASKQRWIFLKRALRSLWVWSGSPSSSNTVLLMARRQHQPGPRHAGAVDRSGAQAQGTNSVFLVQNAITAMRAQRHGAILEREGNSPLGWAGWFMMKRGGSLTFALVQL